MRAQEAPTPAELALAWLAAGWWRQRRSPRLPGVGSEQRQEVLH